MPEDANAQLQKPKWIGPLLDLCLRVPVWQAVGYLLDCRFNDSVQWYAFAVLCARLRRSAELCLSARYPVRACCCCPSDTGIFGVLVDDRCCCILSGFTGQAGQAGLVTAWSNVRFELELGGGHFASGVWYRGSRSEVPTNFLKWVFWGPVEG